MQIRAVLILMLAPTSVAGQSDLLKPYFQAVRDGHTTFEINGGSSVGQMIQPKKIGNVYIYERTNGGGWQDRWTFQGERWLDCQGSECKPGVIRLRTMRLEDKAAAFEAAIAARHDRHGMVTGVRLKRAGDLSSSQTHSDDNDGLWTAMYAVAKLYEYKATGSAAALARAETATKAVLFLEKVTEMPGYPARSYITKGEEKPKDGRWHMDSKGVYDWKSDTSSDEIVGHFYLFAEAWDLLPPGELRDSVRETCRRMMDRILMDGYNLVDDTWKPTTWGKWTPEYFGTPGGKPDSPLNSMELLSFLRITEHVTGDKKYDREFEKVAHQMGYLKILGQQKQLREEINYSDEELAMLSFFPLLKYEKNPEYRKAVGAAMEDWFENMRRQKNPLWNAMYEAVWKKDAALRQDAIATLQRIPMDLVTWKVEASQRADVPRVAGKSERFGRAETTLLLPPDERPMMKWNGNPFVMDGGNGGMSEEAGTFFLLPYWMGRYYGLWREK